ncbi:MAG: hypothetical protein QM749_15250 [Aquabacterium sp.]
MGLVRLVKEALAKMMYAFMVLGTSLTCYAQQYLSFDSLNRQLYQSYSNNPYESAFEHIDPKTGQVTVVSNDMIVPGNGGLDIVVQRVYTIEGYDLDGGSSGPYPGGPRLMGELWDINIPSIYKDSYSVAGADSLVRKSSPGGCQFTMFGDIYNRPPYGIYLPTLQLTSVEGGRRVTKPLYRASITESGYSEITVDNWRSQCITDPADGNWGRVIYAPDGKRYVYSYHPGSSYQWYLTKVSDRNGNWLQYNYGSAWSPDNWPVLNSITSSDGRQINFTYINILGRPHIASIAGPSGTVRYSYETYTTSRYAGATPGPLADVSFPWRSLSLSRVRLTKVTLADNTYWSMSYYPMQSLGDIYTSVSENYDKLQSITTPAGGVVTYNYDYQPSADADRALLRKTTSGTLPAQSWEVSNRKLWQTQYANYAMGRRVQGVGYCHDLIYGNTSAAWSSNNTRPAWSDGLLLIEITYSDDSCSSVVEQETFTYDKRQIGPYPACAPGCGYNDPATYAPLMTGRVVNRDGQAYSTTYSNFDPYGFPQTIVESGPNGGSRTRTISYYSAPNKWILGEFQSETFSGGALSRTFDGNANVLSLTQDGVTTSFTYDGQGNVSTKTLPRGLMHSYSNYKRGIPQTEAQPEGVNIIRVVDDAGNITSETNGVGKTTTYTYDGLNRFTSITYPQGNPKSIVYAANSRTATRGSLVEVTEYDGFGRATSVTLGGINTTYSYDAHGRKSFESNPGDSIGTSYEYDTLNRLTRITNADQTYRTVSYGPASATVTDERNNEWTYNYRSYGDPSQQFLMGIVAPESSANISLTRNARDLVDTVTQGGFTRTYGYNSQYYLTSVNNPETGVTTYGRDDAGNMTSYQVGTSGQTTFAYDGRNRLTSVTYPAGTPNVTKTYTKTDKLASTTNSAVARTFIYDNNDNLQFENFLISGNSFQIGYAYNGNDQLSMVTYPVSHQIVDYAPDMLGRPTRVGNYVTGVTYWPSGQFKQITYGNGVVSNYGQNNRLWSSAFDTKQGATAYLNSAYDYDGTGNLLSITDSADNSYNRTLGYDGINRIITASGPWGIGKITYDGVGNIKNQLYGSSSLFYNYGTTNNRLLSVIGARTGSYTYDAIGNIITGQGNTYAYNSVPNLTCVNCANPATKVMYTYDGLNKRSMVTKGGSATLNSMAAMAIC